MVNKTPSGRSAEHLVEAEGIEPPSLLLPSHTSPPEWGFLLHPRSPRFNAL